MGGETKPRRAIRKTADIRVHLEGPGSGTVLLSRDWSYSGVFLRTNQPLPIGTPLTMSAVVGRPPRKLHMRGRVMRVVRDSGDRSQRSVVGMGIALDSMPAELRAFLGHLAEAEANQPTPAQARAHPVEHDVDMRFPEDEKTEPLKNPLAFFATISRDEEAEDIQEILVIARPARKHAAAVRNLTARGIGVIEATGGGQAIAALRDGHAPFAVVVFDDSGKMLENIAPHFTVGLRPRVAIAYGAVPKEPRGGFGFPVLALPGDSDFNRILELAQFFAADEEKEPVFLRNSQEENRRQR